MFNLIVQKLYGHTLVLNDLDKALYTFITYDKRVMARFVLHVLLIVIFNFESILARHDEKRILLTDPDYAENLQLHRKIQTLKSPTQEKKQTVVSQSTLIQKQTVEITNLQTKLQQREQAQL